MRLGVESGRSVFECKSQRKSFARFFFWFAGKGIWRHFVDSVGSAGHVERHVFYIIIRENCIYYLQAQF